MTVIDTFLDCETKDYTWIKDVSEKELLGEIHKANPFFKFKTKPYKHQLASILLGIYNNSFLFFLDMGLGKSRCVLDILAIKPLTKKILIVVPNLVTIGSWEDEVIKHSNFTCTKLLGAKNERLELFKEDTNIYIVNYAGLMVYLTNMVKGKRQINLEKVEKFTSKFEAVIYDEIHYAKDPKTLTFSLCKEISLRMKYRYGLTGTPINRDVSALWSLFYLIDFGETFTENLGFFKTVFFSKELVSIGFRKKRYFYKYTFNPRLESKLYKKVRNKSIRYETEEAIDLPEKIYQKIHLNLSDEAKMYYSLLVKKAKEQKSEERTAINLFVKLRQLSSGFLYYESKEDNLLLSNEKIATVFSKNEKLEALLEIIETTKNESKILVFVDFIKSGEIIEAALKERKIGCIRLYGGTEDKVFVKDEFLKNKNVRVLIANSASGSVALNFQDVCNYTVFYESPVSCIVRSQAEKRVHRIGQTKKVIIYDLVCSFIEQRILDFLKEGKDLMEHIIKNKQEFIDAQEYLPP